MAKNSNDKGTCLSPEEQKKLDLIAEGVVRGLQKIDDLTAGTDALFKSGVSKCCSANSNGCEINSQTIAAPAPSPTEPAPAPARPAG